MHLKNRMQLDALILKWSACQFSSFLWVIGLLFQLLGEPGTGGSSTPSMVGAVKKWQKSDPQNSAETWKKLSEANSALEMHLKTLCKLAEIYFDDYKSTITKCSTLTSEKVHTLPICSLHLVAADIIISFWTNTSLIWFKLFSLPCRSMFEVVNGYRACNMSFVLHKKFLSTFEDTVISIS